MKEEDDDGDFADDKEEYIEDLEEYEYEGECLKVTSRLFCAC